MPSSKPEIEAAERKAFLAGFDISSEGFNGEWGPTDEWIELHFREWKHGETVPDKCGAENPGQPPEGYYRTVCSRPAGHDGAHQASHGHKDYLTWT